MASLLLALFIGNRASAQATLLDGFGGARGFGADCLGPNDDGSSLPVDLTPYFPGGLAFFGATYTTLYVNTNGNVSLGSPLPTYTPRSFPAADHPVIAPYWSDVDTRVRGAMCVGTGGGGGTAPACDDPADNGVWWHGESGLFVATWDQVGYYNCHNDHVMSFQLVLRVPEMCAAEADIDVEFRYANCEWTTGDRSSGVGGFGGIEAQAGFDAGDSLNFVEIPGSREPNIHRKLCEQSNVGDPGVWRFRIRGGDVLCPDAGTRCDTGQPGVCGLGRTYCVGGTTMCRQEGVAATESCDGLDDDCNGMVDDGAMCSGAQICDNGRCVEPCFEGGCPTGRVCSHGSCVRSDCTDVICAGGKRCQFGVCVDACTGIACPHGQTCAAGHCADPCDGVDCGACGLCQDGLCVDRCDLVGCAPSTTCEPSGACVADACAGVACATGEYCEAGRCISACEGARCPHGQSCVDGSCVMDAAPDAGVDAGVDAGGGDAGVDASLPDSGVADAGHDAQPDAGREVPTASGCGCAVGQSSSRMASWCLLGLLAVLWRRWRS